MTSHWQPHDNKEYMADDIRAWVQRTVDPEAKLLSLTRLSSLDLTVLMLAVHKAEEDQKVKS